MHHDRCPAEESPTKRPGTCRCGEPEFFLAQEWDGEDVHHLDEMILAEKCRSDGLLALPGLEHVRNMIAARVGVPVQPLGWDLRDDRSPT